MDKVRYSKLSEKQKRIHLDKFNKYQRNRRKERRDKINKIKKEYGGCKKCGWNKHSMLLVFHHRNKITKAFSIDRGSITNRKWEIVLREIKKCDLLCPICHNWLHYKEREKFKKFGKRKNKLNRKYKYRKIKFYFKKKNIV